MDFIKQFKINMKICRWIDVSCIWVWIFSNVKIFFAGSSRNISIQDFLHTQLFKDCRSEWVFPYNLCYLLQYYHNFWFYCGSKRLGRTCKNKILLWKLCWAIWSIQKSSFPVSFTLPKIQWSQSIYHLITFRCLYTCL